jgi:uncharacterized membrane protein
MTNYVYQFDIGFQYTYASVAFLFYLVTMNVGDLNAAYAKKLLLCGVCASMCFFASVNLPRKVAIEDYQSNKERNQKIIEALATIPYDKSITSTTFFIPSLWDRDEVYELAYTDEVTDYVVIDIRWSTTEYRKFSAAHPEYETVLYEKGAIAILKMSE